MAGIEQTDNPHGFGANDLPINTSYDALVGDMSIAAHFSRLTEDKSVAPFNEYFDETVIQFLGRLPLPPNFSLVDISCGDGKTLERIRSTKSLQVGTLRGSDISHEMVRLAQAKHPGIDVTQGDMRSVFSGESDIADVALTINAVHYLPTIEDVEKTYNNAHRIVKPGGYLIVVTGDHASTAGWRGMQESELKERIEKGREPMDWSMPDKDMNPVFRLRFYPYMNEEHQNALVQAGFRDVSMVRTYPPPLDMKEYSPPVFEMLSTKPNFVFYIARKSP